MKPAQMLRSIVGVLVSLTLSSCSGGVPSAQDAGARTASFAVDRSTVVEQLVRPKTQDWSFRRATNASLDRMRNAEAASRGQTDAATRKLQALASVGTALSNAAGGASGRISSAPAYDYLTHRAYWLTDTGWLIAYKINAGATAPTFYAAWQVKDSAAAVQSYQNTAITLSSDGRRAYTVSTNGTFVVSDLYNNAACLYSFPMGVNNAVTNTGTGFPATTCPAPYIDVPASRPDGQWETVYAIANSGANTTTLHRFAVMAQAGQAVSVTHPQGYVIPMAATEGVRVSPVVLAGKAVIGTWIRNTLPTVDTGTVRLYNTGCPTFTTAATTGSQTTSVAVSAPVWAPPAVDLDDNLNPIYTFTPTAQTVTMVDLAAGTKQESVPLLVDKYTPPVTYNQTMLGPPVTTTAVPITPAGSMDNYPYSGATTFVTHTPDTGGGASCDVTISEDTTALNPGPGGAKPWLSLTDFFSYSNYDGGAAQATWKACYNYVRYTFGANDVVVAGEAVPRGVKGVNVRYHSTNSSNAAAVAGYPAYTGWIVKNTLAGSATLWDPTNITPATRPTFANGDAFSVGTNYNASVLASGAHNAEQLTPNPANNPAGNAFVGTGGGKTYDWDATGLITPGTTKTVAFYDDEDQLGNAPNNGKPHNVGAPHFDTPQLVIELSANGTAGNAMLMPCSLDTVNSQVYVVNCNALFRVSYQSFTYTSTNPASANYMYLPAATTERFQSMQDPKRTFYAMTKLGGSSSYSPLYSSATAPVSRFVSNYTAPLITYSNVYVQDNWMSTANQPNRTTIREFTFGTPPTATLDSGTPPVATGSDFDLSGTAADALGPATFMVFDYETLHLFAATFDPVAATNNGRIWVLNR